MLAPVLASGVLHNVQMALARSGHNNRISLQSAMNALHWCFDFDTMDKMQLVYFYFAKVLGFPAQFL